MRGKAATRPDFLRKRPHGCYCSKTGPRRESTVHPGDAVVPRAEKPGHGLQIDQREYPVIHPATARNRLLDVVILRRDQNIEIVRGRYPAAIRSHRVRRRTLHEGRLRRIVHEQLPRFVVAELRRQPSKQRAPLRTQRREPRRPPPGPRTPPATTASSMCRRPNEPESAGQTADYAWCHYPKPLRLRPTNPGPVVDQSVTADLQNQATCRRRVHPRGGDLLLPRRRAPKQMRR